MRALPLITMLAASPAADDAVLQAVVDRGEQVFNASCATGYCHAIRGGAGGGGARLAARGFSQEHIRTVAGEGRPGTAMPGFKDRLAKADLDAVVAYVATLNGIDRPDIGVAGEAPASSRPALSEQAEKGRALFHDSLRGFERCATCHQVRGSGVPVAEPIASVPASVRELHVLATPNVATVTTERESMPGLVVSRGEHSVLFYDLTIPPPVLRTVSPAGVSIEPGSRWAHGDVTRSYSDAELASILDYLREVTR
jgi:mono/diheme cytochrome c family protein